MSTLLLVLVLGADVPPDNIPGKREWLLSHMIVDMQQQGVYDSDKFAQLEKMIRNQTPDQIRQLVRYYQAKKKEVKEMAEAERKVLADIARAQQQRKYEEAVLNKQRLEAYRDHLKREFDMKMLTFQQERDLTNYGTRMAQMMFWSQANRIFWPNYNGYGYWGGGYRYPVRTYPHRHYYHRR